MSKPTQEQAESIAQRISRYLDEWDDNAFVIMIQCSNGNFVHLLRGDPMTRTIMARGLLNDAISQHQRIVKEAQSATKDQPEPTDSDP